MTFLFYFFIEISSIGLFYFGQSNLKYKEAFQFLSFCILYFVLVLRDYSVGAAYQNYIYAINRIANKSILATDNNWLGLGFRSFVKLIAIIFNRNYYPLIFSVFIISIISLVTLFFFFKSFNKLSVNPTFSLYLFLCFCLYFQLMNQFRQMFAVSLVLYSYTYVNKSFMKYALCILIAASFHQTAIIMLPMFFLAKLNINKKTLTSYFIVAILVSLFADKIRILLQYTTYSNYLGWTQYDVGMTSTTIINLVIRLFLLVLCIFKYKEVVNKDKKSNYLYHMIIICTIFQVLSVQSSLFTRITTYFFVFYIILIPKVTDVYKEYITSSSIKIYNLLIYILFMTYQIIYYLYQSTNGGYAVYKSIF